MRQFATYFPATQRQNLPDKTSRFGKTSFPSPLQSVAERLLISFAPLNCCYHIINKLSLCQPIYRTKVHFLKIVQTTHTFSRFIDYQLFTPYILNTITVISLLTAKTRLYRRFFLAEKERSVVALQQTSLLLRGFWRKRDSPYSENGRVYSHSGACNGEFGGAAVVCNQCLFDCTESLFGRQKTRLKRRVFWRRKRDSNSRTVSHGYTISSRAPSTN